MENLINILDENLMIGLVVLLLIVPIYYKMGLLGFLFGKNKDTISTNERDIRDGNFQIDISRELGGIHEKLKSLPGIKKEVKRLADHVNVQNGRIAKLEDKVK